MDSLLKKISNSGKPITASQAFRNVYVQTSFWVLLAFLVFIQDYVDSNINDKGYYISESLLFKTFWLLFIPFSLLWFRLYDFISDKKNSQFWISSIILSLTFSLTHLIAFSALISTVSNAIYSYGWSFGKLFYEVLSGRAYFVLIVYLSYTIIYPWVHSRESSPLASRLIKLKSGTKSYIIDMDDILWVTVENSVTMIKTASKKHIYGGSLKEIQGKLDTDNFKKIHRSTIVNINEVAQLTSRLNGDYDVTMKDNTSVRLSRNYVKAVKDRLL